MNAVLHRAASVDAHPLVVFLPALPKESSP